MNVSSRLLERARHEPDAIALYFPDGRSGRRRFRPVRLGELDRESDAMAHGLASLGINAGTRVALMVRPGFELFALTLALFKAGAVPVVIDPGLGVRRLGRCLDEARPEVFIGIPAAQALGRMLRWARAHVRTRVTTGRAGWGAESLPRLCEAGRAAGRFPVHEAEANDAAAILFTSGSTGPPKGVIYRQRNFDAQLQAIRDLGEIRAGEVDVATFPLFALFDPALSMTAVVPDMDPTRPGSVDPKRIYEAVEEFGASSLFGSPALLDTVSRDGVAGGVKLGTLRRVVSAGAPVSAEIQQRFLRLMPEGAEILTPYGATECLPVACISSKEILSETAVRTEGGAGVCVGRPVPSVEVRILAIDDGPVERWQPELERPPGEIGEICVFGPQATSGYFGRPRDTALAKIVDVDDRVWHRMGDLGYFDEVGRLWYCGRKADRVQAKGVLLTSLPCEAVFDTHPEVRRTALVGVPRDGEGEGKGDGRETELPVLCVEPLIRLGRRDRERITGELRALGQRTPHTRLVEHFLFRRGFPMDIRHNAKIGRPELARWAARRIRP